MSSYLEQDMLTLERSQPTLLNQGSFWRKEPPQLDEEGRVVRGGLFPHQLQWWNLEEFIKVLVGGYGAGKTMVGSKRIISLALMNAPYPVAAISPTFGIAEHTTIATVNALLAGKQSILGRDFGFKLRKKPQPMFTIRYRGIEGTILIYSGEKPESLRGPNLAAAWIDEPFLQDIEVYLQMIARVRAPGAKKSELLLTGTPEQLNWGYDLCIGELKDRHPVGVIHANTKENKALSQGYISRLTAAFDGKAADAYIGGHFVNLAKGVVYYAFDHTLNVQSQQADEWETLKCGIKIPRGVELGAGMDFNVNPMSAAVFWKAGNHVHYIDEIELPNADTEFMCAVLREKYGDRLKDVYPDATGTARKTSAPGGKSDFHFIREAGFATHARHENPKRRDRYNSVNGKMKPGNYKPSLTIEPTCKKLIKYFSTYSYELINKQEALSHLLDAATYPIAYLFPVDKEQLSIHQVVGV